jgi:hypothetical protein
LSQHFPQKKRFKEEESLIAAFPVAFWYNSAQVAQSAGSEGDFASMMFRRMSLL